MGPKAALRATALQNCAGPRFLLCSWTKVMRRKRKVCCFVVSIPASCTPLLHKACMNQGLWWFYIRFLWMSQVGPLPSSSQRVCGVWGARQGKDHARLRDGWTCNNACVHSWGDSFLKKFEAWSALRRSSKRVCFASIARRKRRPMWPAYAPFGTFCCFGRVYDCISFGKFAHSKKPVLPIVL